MKIELTKEQISLINNMINIELHYEQETVYDKGELTRLKKAFDMPVVSRSIGSDTKLTLKRLTKQQQIKHFAPCSICKLETECVNNANIFDKCVNENDYDQYYG